MLYFLDKSDRGGIVKPLPDRKCLVKGMGLLVLGEFQLHRVRAAEGKGCVQRRPAAAAATGGGPAERGPFIEEVREATIDPWYRLAGWCGCG